MDLVKDHQAIFIGSQKQGGFHKLGTVLTRFKVKVQCFSIRCDFQCQRRFANLTRTDQTDGSLAI
jgi:hypothetical protein